MSYNTTLQLSDFLSVTMHVPSLDPGESRGLDSLGASDGTTRFYLSKSRILSDTYTIYYGETEDEATGQSLTETTHYIINKESGYIELTTDGKTLIGVDSSNNLYAGYKYVNPDVSLTDSQLQDYLDKANKQIETDTYSVFVDGTTATPGYVQVYGERQTGKGYSNRSYFLNRYPVKTFNTNLNGALSEGDGTVKVDSTDGFPESGYILVGSDKIKYTGKDSNNFTGCSSVDSHDDNSVVYPFVIEVSYTGDGYDVDWNVLQEGVDFHLDGDSGRVYLYSDSLDEVNDVVYSTKPPYQLPNRLRAYYLTGYDEIPEDIKRCELMIAAQDITHTVVRKNVATGNDGFQPSMINVDKEWIQSTIEKYKIYKSTNI